MHNDEILIITTLKLILKTNDYNKIKINNSMHKYITHEYSEVVVVVPFYFLSDGFMHNFF